VSSGKQGQTQGWNSDKQGAARANEVMTRCRGEARQIEAKAMCDSDEWGRIGAVTTVGAPNRSGGAWEACMVNWRGGHVSTCACGEDAGSVWWERRRAWARFGGRVWLDLGVGPLGFS
jgi:hypothetical protein